MSDPFARLRELCRDLPEDLVADWRGTNHFELHSPHSMGDYFWLDIADFGVSESISGQRAGLLLDIAAECSRLKKEGHLCQSVAERVATGLQEFVDNGCVEAGKKS